MAKNRHGSHRKVAIELKSQKRQQLWWIESIKLWNLLNYLKKSSNSYYEYIQIALKVKTANNHD